MSGSPPRTSTATEKGAKKRNQDRAVVHDLSQGHPSSQDELLLAVFDGHGDNGEEVAEYLKARLLHHAAQPAQAEGERDLREWLRADPVEGLKALFQKLEADLAQESSIDCYISGSTACIAHLCGSRLTVGNLGDTRAVLASYPEGKKDSGKERTAKANVITRDHTCQEEEEKQRILDNGGRVEALLENGQPVGKCPETQKGIHKSNEMKFWV